MQTLILGTVCVFVFVFVFVCVFIFLFLILLLFLAWIQSGSRGAGAVHTDAAEELPLHPLPQLGACVLGGAHGIRHPTSLRKPLDTQGGECAAVVMEYEFSQRPR